MDVAFQESVAEFVARIKPMIEAKAPPKLKQYFLRCFEPWPDWVIKILQKYLKVYCPSLTEKESKLIPDLINALIKGEKKNLNQESAILIGKIQGHFLAWIEKIPEIENNSPQVEYIKNIYEDIENTKGRIIDAIPLNQLPKYAAAFSKAHDSTFDKNGHPKEAPSRPIYRVLLFEWPKIEQMKSVSELEARLNFRYSGKFVVDRKNLEFICNEIGLRFRSAGRPPKFLAPPKTS